MKGQEKLKNQAAETEAVLALATYVCLYFSLSYSLFLPLFTLSWLILLCVFLSFLSPWSHTFSLPSVIFSLFFCAVSLSWHLWISVYLFILFSLQTNFLNPFLYGGTSLMSHTVKNLPAVQETWVWSLGQHDLLEKGMTMHSSLLAWKIPWTEEHGRL